MGHVREGCLCKKRQVKQMCYHFSVATHAKSRNRTPGHIVGRRVLSPLHCPCSQQTNTWSFKPITCKESVIFMIIQEIPVHVFKLQIEMYVYHTQSCKNL